MYSSPINCKNIQIAVRDEKLGGFQPRFPLYRTETHLCGSQRRAPRKFKQLKGKRL
jgi:hypothetical protein